MTKTALVTGAARGIGRATVNEFQSHEWNTLAVDIQPMADAGDGISVHICDVSDSTAVAQLFAELKEAGIALQAVVNNAAIQWVRPIEETGMDEWNRVIATNLSGAYDVCRQAGGLFSGEGGAIVNVSSVHALATSNGRAAYAASKGGLVAMTRALAVELAPRHIRVNAVLPGAVDTAMLTEGFEQDKGVLENAEMARRELASKIPLGRLSQPEEIARAIYFLSDDLQSSYVTGHTLVVDGGVTAHLSSA